ncbi:GNAT family N-acetyltransferase [Pontibacter brevis]
MKFNFNQLPSIETQNLLLRKVTLSDAEDVFAFTSDSRTSERLTWEPHKDVDHTRNFLRSLIEKYEQNVAAQWAVCLRSTNKVIGFCGFINYHEEHKKGEVAYVLSPEHWGKGYLTEGLNAIIQHCFTFFDFNRIEAKCEADNIASEKVMQKVGMKSEGYMRRYIIRKGNVHDYKLYSIIKEDYSNLNTAK